MSEFQSGRFPGGLNGAGGSSPPSIEQQLDFAKSELAALREELAECITEMTLAITYYETRTAMTVVGRTRFMEILQKYNAKQPTESGASE